MDEESAATCVAAFALQPNAACEGLDAHGCCPLPVKPLVHKGRTVRGLVARKIESGPGYAVFEAPERVRFTKVTVRPGLNRRTAGVGVVSAADAPDGPWRPIGLFTAPPRA